MANAGLAWYKTGTVNITQGSPGVTGVSTHWATAGVKTGDMFTVDDTRDYEVYEVLSDTALTLAKPFQGASGNAQNYAVIRNWSATMTAELAARVAELVNKYEWYIDADLSRIIGPKGEPGWSYKGTWASGRGYSAMDITVYEDALYIALISHTSASANSPVGANSLWMGMGVVIQNATESAPGMVTLATSAEALAGTDPAKVMTPLTARGAIDSTPAGNPATIFANPGAGDMGTRVVTVSDAAAGKSPMYMLYGTAGTQIYLVQTYGSASRIEQRAVLISGSGREFERQFAGSAWSAWRERPTFAYSPNNLTLIVDGENGDDSTANGTEALPYKTIQAALNAVQAVFCPLVTIKVKAGTYLSPLALYSFLGRGLTITSYSGGKDVTIAYGSSGTFVSFESFHATLRISNLKFINADPSTGNVGVRMTLIHRASVSNCEFEGFTLGDKSCVLFWNCFSIYASNCIFQKAGNGLYVLNCSNAVSSNNTSGGDLSYGLAAQEATIRRVSTQPVGTIADTVTYGGGQIL